MCVGSAQVASIMWPLLASSDTRRTSRDDGIATTTALPPWTGGQLTGRFLGVGWLGWRCGWPGGRSEAGVLVNNAIITLSAAADAGLAAIATRTALDPFSYHGQICWCLLFCYLLCQLVWCITMTPPPSSPQPAVLKSMQDDLADSRKTIANYFNLFVCFYCFFTALRFTVAIMRFIHHEGRQHKQKEKHHIHTNIFIRSKMTEIMERLRIA